MLQLPTLPLPQKKKSVHIDMDFFFPQMAQLKVRTDDGVEFAAQPEMVEIMRQAFRLVGEKSGKCW